MINVMDNDQFYYDVLLNVFMKTHYESDFCTVCMHKRIG